MRALVTGASGFIGSALVERLAADGWEVRALLRASSSLRHLGAARFERVEGHLGDETSLARAVAGCEVVFHLAGSTKAPSRDAFFEANSRGTERLVRAAATAGGVRRFVLVSSLAAAGPAEGRAAPRGVCGRPDSPVSAYGESKLAGEQAALAFRERLPITILRPPIVYGPRDEGVFVVLKGVARGFRPRVSAGSPEGSKFYSAIHVADLVDVLVRAGGPEGAALPSGTVLYPAGDEALKFEEILDAMADAVGRRGVGFQVPVAAIRAAAWGCSALGRLLGREFAFNQDKLNEILPDYWICSARETREKLGFSPKFPIREGMRDAVAWYRREGWL